MKTLKMIKTLAMMGVSLTLLSSQIACGDTEETAESGPRTGKTSCGTFGLEKISCSAGQYCEDQVLNTCSDGCTSDANCAANQYCIKEGGSNVGTCQSGKTQPTNNANPPTGVQARCEAAIDKGRSCEALTAQEVAIGKAACADTTSDGQLLAKAIADCVDAAGVCGQELTTCFKGDTPNPNNTNTCTSQGAGFTQCGDDPFISECCQPGQYCADAAFGECEIGCTSNVNCAADQRCDLSEGAPGTCR
jgi:hypothetical protein